MLVILIAFVVAIGFSQDGNNYPIENIQKEKRRPVYLGAWVEGFWDNETKNLDTSAQKKFEKKLGKKMAFANIYSEWTYLENAKLQNDLEEISHNGWVPIISSNPFFFSKCSDEGISLYKTIAEGYCDEFLSAAGENLRGYKEPIFFRFAWEMNLPDMYWSIKKTNSTPEEFKNAWRRIHDIWGEAGVENIVWVLSFNTSHPKTIPYHELYPGDDYVDWVAIDGYNWGNSYDWSNWTDFNGVFRNSYNELTKISDKPMMLSEVNSAEVGGDKAAWLEDMMVEQIPNNFPEIEMIVFFNENKSQGERVDWRIEKSSEYISAVQKGFENDIYQSSYPY